MSKASGWGVERFLSSLYWLFKDSPARRKDFIAVTCSPLMPVKFCSYRWVENVSVCERGIAILPGVNKYVAAVNAKTYTDPGNKSSSAICQCNTFRLVYCMYDDLYLIAQPVMNRSMQCDALSAIITRSSI